MVLYGHSRISPKLLWGLVIQDQWVGTIQSFSSLTLIDPELNFQQKWKIRYYKIIFVQNIEREFCLLLLCRRPLCPHRKQCLPCNQVVDRELCISILILTLMVFNRTVDQLNSWNYYDTIPLGIYDGNMLLGSNFQLQKLWSFWLLSVVYQSQKQYRNNIETAITLSNWYETIPSRQLTVHWQPKMVKFHSNSDFHLPQSQNCLLGKKHIL